MSLCHRLEKEEVLKKDELHVTDLAGRLATAFAALEQTHPADLPDVVYHIHAIQNIIMARSAQRVHPDEFPTYTSEGQGATEAADKEIDLRSAV